MNKTAIIPFVSAFLYLIFLIAIGLTEYDNARILIKRYRLRHRLAKADEQSKMSLWAGNLLGGVFGKPIDGIWLWSFCLLIFASTFLIALRSFLLIPSLILSIFCSAMPVLLLFSKLQSIRNKGGREGLNLVTEMYRQYKMNDRNILLCLEKCMESDSSIKTSKKHIYILLLKLRDSSSKENIRNACNSFAFSLGGIWGRMLAACIEEAVYFGTDISEGLLDITNQLRQAEKRNEERKRLNSESARMTLFLVPFLYIATLFVSIKYLGISAGKYIHNQFLTPEGVLFLLVSIFLFVVNIVLISVTGNERVDY